VLQRLRSNKLCEVGGDGYEFWINEHPFCTADQSCCGFVAGYMSGFLESNPSAHFASIEQLGCGSGFASCTFLVAV